MLLSTIFWVQNGGIRLGNPNLVCCDRLISHMIIFRKLDYTLRDYKIECSLTVTRRSKTPSEKLIKTKTILSFECMFDSGNKSLYMYTLYLVRTMKTKVKVNCSLLSTGHNVARSLVLCSVIYRYRLTSRKVCQLLNCHYMYNTCTCTWVKNL